jgi:Tfp pilus assembly protein PilO
MSNLISIFLILVSIGVFFGYVSPTYSAVTGNIELKDQSIRELKEEEGRYIDALNKTKEIEQARTGLLEEFARMPKNGRERLEKLLPDHIDSVRLIIDVNNISAQYGMALKNISLTEFEPSNAATASLSLGPATERFKSVGLKFSVEGAYDNFRSFIRDLEQSLRLVDIETISFSSREELYEYVISVLTYRLSADSAK